MSTPKRFIRFGENYLIQVSNIDLIKIEGNNVVIIFKEERYPFDAKMNKLGNIERYEQFPLLVQPFESKQKAVEFINELEHQLG